MVILKFVIVFTVMLNDGTVRSSVMTQTADSLDQCESAVLVAERTMLESINKGEMKQGFAECKAVKVNVPTGKGV